MKTRRITWSSTGRLLLVGTMTLALAACGGSSGDSSDTGDGDFFDPADVDGDGVLNVDDEDFADDVDGDGIPNSEDEDYDPNDRDGDGLANDVDDDIDGDGLANADDTDADGDGFTDVTAEQACGGASGSDASSTTAEWNDNCTIERRNQFSDSLYSAGIQRVVYCTVDTVAGASVDAFTDGEFGEGTETAVVAYQTLRELGADGAVGPQTWASLQTELALVQPATLTASAPSGFDSYTVAGDRCGGAVLFYQEVATSADGLGIDAMGWKLSQGAASPAQVDFSTALPFGLID